MAQVIKKGLTALFGWVGLRALIGKAPRRSNRPGPGENLPVCSKYPNCVSSQASDAEHAIEPFAYSGPAEQAQAALKRALSNVERSRIVVERPGYISAVARSKVFGFVDDLDFLFDPEEPLIHVRSAARLGRRDFDVNRQRMERIRQLFQAEQR